MAGEHEQALDFANQAVQFNPNSSLVHSRCGWALVHCDEQQRALESFDLALRLSPVDPEKYISVAGKGIALFFSCVSSRKPQIGLAAPNSFGPNTPSRCVFLR